MRYSPWNGFDGFTVIDAGTGQKVPGVLWVDDVAMEYATYDIPLRPVGFGAYGIEYATTTVKVTAVRLNYPAKEIHVNEPVSLLPAIAVRELHACGECMQSETCRRIGTCVAHRCCFGEAVQP